MAARQGRSLLELTARTTEVEREGERVKEAPPIADCVAVRASREVVNVNAAAPAEDEVEYCTWRKAKL